MFVTTFRTTSTPASRNLSNSRA